MDEEYLYNFGQDVQTNQTDQLNQSMLTEEEQRLLDMIKEYPDMTNILLAQTLGWSVSRVKYYVQRLKNQERLKEKEAAVIGNGKYCK